ncbi:dihydrouridine synthase (Dus) domain-containing protein [Ditylenchus destructor]|uniref:tRNA-dihydrouridine(47) synthase [NAD(P)(+)] n=1 Tax=Ditylenchus destructor TaxID=166010 RepID=A0AAD4NA70_9BILA|nr:dihydrouridine synthase (Dus) domain-containing protein [Ditylenchus destructor]
MPSAKYKYGDKCTALHSKEEYWSRRLRILVDLIDINLGCRIDSINEKGTGCALGNKSNCLMNVLRCMNTTTDDVPITMKMRIKEGERNTHYAIEERPHCDITSTERLGVIKKFVNYGLENWDSDHMGV